MFESITCSMLTDAGTNSAFMLQTMINSLAILDPVLHFFSLLSLAFIARQLL